MRHVSSPDREPAATLGGDHDRLGIWTRLARPFGFGGGAEKLTVHRLLADPRAGGRATATRLHDLIAEALPPLERPRLLDAGCGLGGTMLDLVARYSGTAIGLTLSRSQQQRANASAAARGLSEQVEAVLQSYDSPPAGPFDLVVAIESLAHSSNPATSVEALSKVLAPGGHLVVVDDMPEAAALGSTSFARFRHGWRAPVVWSRSDYLAAFERLGLAVVTDLDLTAQSHVRTLPQIARMERLNRAVHRLVPQRWQVVFDSYYGGLALERLYRQGQMRYRLLVAARQSAAAGIR